MEDRTGTRQRDHRQTTEDGRLVDRQGNVVPGTSGWRQHPQASRATRRLQPMPDPRAGDPYDARGRRREDWERDEWDRQGAQQQPNVNVTVSNGGSYYRPWKEELLISGWRSFGNLLAFPFRLVGNLLGGVLRLALIAVVVPSLIFGSISYYQSNRDRGSAEMAHDIGKAGVGLVGSALHGVWDGLFGSDEPAPARKGGADGAEEPRR